MDRCQKEKQGDKEEEKLSSTFQPLLSFVPTDVGSEGPGLVPSPGKNHLATHSRPLSADMECPWKVQRKVHVFSDLCCG